MQASELDSEPASPRSRDSESPDRVLQLSFAFQGFLPEAVFHHLVLGMVEEAGAAR